MAEISPATAGAPEAIATPSENGVHRSATWMPATRSSRQWRRPAIPVAGKSRLVPVADNEVAVSLMLR